MLCLNVAGFSLIFQSETISNTVYTTCLSPEQIIGSFF